MGMYLLFAGKINLFRYVHHLAKFKQKIPDTKKQGGTFLMIMSIFSITPYKNETSYSCIRPFIISFYPVSPDHTVQPATFKFWHNISGVPN